MVKVFIVLVGLALAPAVGVAQNSLVVGTWKLVRADVIRPAGDTVADYGSAPSGLAIFTADSQYVIEIYRSPAERMKFASNDRARGTPEEYRDAVMSMSTHFGRYTVDQANHTIAFAATSASYPNREGKTAVLPYTLHGDSLAWRVTARPDGSVPISRFVRVR